MLVETLVEDHVEHAEGASVGVHPLVTVIHPPAADGPRPGTRRTRPAKMDTRQRLQQVLAGQSFPAERWELIAAAEMYGPTWSRAPSCRLSCRSGTSAWPTSCWPWSTPPGPADVSNTSHDAASWFTGAASSPRRGPPPLPRRRCGPETFRVAAARAAMTLFCWAAEVAGSRAEVPVWSRRSASGRRNCSSSLFSTRATLPTASAARSIATSAGQT
jgi:hypothetical protein